ncbi:hypothetical protein FOMPIDRAFT_1019575 [Fomitopsis schrenkii]|uniref:Uncharacterized protein n=1 Tax=Fomitopsis schrenkii TaxID=2126942 RepID=S8DRA0_FOMSC|nr:hypothetical protein FOMPIDRAFT_1019575 [Fomitopsis schrenkii]
MTSSAPDPILPSFLISPSAAQEFIAWQSAEIARLRAHTDQLETRELVAGLKDELVNRTAEHGDASKASAVKRCFPDYPNITDTLKQPKYDSLIKEIREDVIQCKNNISELNNRLKRVGEMLQECADGALQACRVATKEIAKRDSGSTELTKELESTRRALERFRVPELVLTARWEDGGVTVLGRDGDPEESVTEDVEVEERLSPSTPSSQVSFGQEEPDADAEPHTEEDEADITNIPRAPDDARIEEEPTLPASPPDALPNAEPANAVVASASLASEASTDFVHISLPDPRCRGKGQDEDARSTGSDSEIVLPSGSETPPTPPPSAKASPSFGSFGGGAFGRWADHVGVAGTRTIKDLYKPLPDIEDSELTSSIRDELISSRMKAKRRHPEQWEPQEFIGKFFGLWYYFGTYSFAGEPVPVTKEEFIQLSYKDKEAFVTEYKLCRSSSAVSREDR